MNHMSVGAGFRTFICQCTLSFNVTCSEQNGTRESFEANIITVLSLLGFELAQILYTCFLVAVVRSRQAWKESWKEEEDDQEIEYSSQRN